MGLSKACIHICQIRQRARYANGIGARWPHSHPQKRPIPKRAIILSFLNEARKNIDFELTRMIENVKRPKTMDFERTGMIEYGI